MSTPTTDDKETCKRLSVFLGSHDPESPAYKAYLAQLDELDFMLPPVPVKLVALLMHPKDPDSALIATVLFSCWVRDHDPNDEDSSPHVFLPNRCALAMHTVMMGSMASVSSHWLPSKRRFLVYVFDGKQKEFVPYMHWSRLGAEDDVCIYKDILDERGFEAVDIADEPVELVAP